MSASEDAERRARVTLSFLADPGDPVLGAALRVRTATAVLAATTSVTEAGELQLPGEPEEDALARAATRYSRPAPVISSRWRSRLKSLMPSSASRALT